MDVPDPLNPTTALSDGGQVKGWVPVSTVVWLPSHTDLYDDLEINLSELNKLCQSLSH
jgi:hypothetical protein